MVADHVDSAPNGGVDSKGTIMQRNKVFAGVSLAVAAAAVGAGALISSNAMADDAPAPSAGTVDVVTIGPDGDTPVHCSFDDLEMPTLVMSAPSDITGGAVAVAVGVSVDGSLPPGVPADGGGTLTVSGGGSSDAPKVVVGGSGTITGSVTNGSIPAGAIPVGSGEAGTLVISGNATPIDIAGGVPPEGLPKLISADQAREGTAEECAAIRANFTVATPAVPATPVTGG